MLPFLLLSLLATAVASVATGPAATYPATQLLNVKDTIKEAETAPSRLPQDLELHENYPIFELDNNSSQSQWKLKLFHRDKLPLNFDPDHPRRFKERISRDSKRVSSLLRLLSSGSDEQVTDFGSDVVSGTEQGSGEYFVRIGVGSPPRSQYVVIDSGSDIVWVQCQPCSECYQQSDPVFDPAGSATYAGISCDSSVCDRLDNAGCNDGRCRYEVSYGDGSYTRGTLALETLTFGRVLIRNIAIGCGHMNRGMFIGAAGLLGLGGGAMSFVGQLGGQTGGAFSYCLVSRGTESTGTLEFGRGAMPVGAAWVPLIRNPRAPSFYYVGLSGLGVGGSEYNTRTNLRTHRFRVRWCSNGHRNRRDEATGAGVRSIPRHVHRTNGKPTSIGQSIDLRHML
ncbi:hypothetical protein CSA_004546 [Cucumis sativus]|uniref:Uncharacterized protein n=1 Tax=Cucumis sativus TaxID=3659 RepID=A0ACB6HCE5_CUCSA|nr:hypothetical protein CSA_004546 [Cucumis sativus]